MSYTLRTVNGDYYIDPNTGMFEEITGVEKISQDLADVLLTPLDQAAENMTSRSAGAFNTDYGSELASINTPSQYGGVLGEPLVSRKIVEAVDRLRVAQKQDISITSEEKFKKISKLVVRQLGVGNFAFYLEVTVESDDRSKVTNFRPVELDQSVLFTSLLDDRLRNG